MPDKIKNGPDVSKSASNIGKSPTSAFVEVKKNTQSTSCVIS